jgi:hypothetical protein
MTFISVVPRDFVELTPLSSVLRLLVTLICKWIGLVVLRLAILSLSVSLEVRATFTMLPLLWVCRDKITLILLLELLFNLYNILVRKSQRGDV